MNRGRKTQRSETLDFAQRVKGAVLWRSGSQIVAQLITWASTFVVIRLLDPHDYGLFAMTQVVLMFLHLLSGWGFAGALIRSETIDRQKVAQVFGMLLLLNFGLALAQVLLAPLAASYFRQPIIADLLRVQALLYLCTPFIAIPNALLSREMDFSRQAKVDLFAAILSAGTALACAEAGWGVWTLVAAPLVLFGTRAIILTAVAKSFVWPSFRFAGAGAMMRFGGAMVAVQFCWFLQVQADVFIAGRILTPHDLGIYTTALFLTQIMATKFVPPLNDVAFAAYSRIQTDRDAIAAAFLKAVRLIMLVALPFYFGLTATAEPMVLTVLGPKWVETVPLVQLLGLAMSFLTLQILFGPVTNAIGRPAIAVRAAAAGAVLLPAAFLGGIQFGTHGMALAWLAALPIFTILTAALSLPAIGVGPKALLGSIAPGFAASAAMTLPVLAIDAALPPLPAAVRLAILVLAGAVTYAGLLLLFARSLVREILSFTRTRAAPAGI